MRNEALYNYLQGGQIKENDVDRDCRTFWTGDILAILATVREESVLVSGDHWLTSKAESSTVRCKMQ